MAASAAESVGFGVQLAPAQTPTDRDQKQQPRSPTPRITRAKTELGNVSNARLRTKAQIHPV
jgi:hypothetical protein